MTASDTITATGLDAAIADLQNLYGDRIQTGRSIREQHAHTTTPIPNQPPDAVVFPQTTEEVAETVRICARNAIPVIPFGTGTSLEGQVNAPNGGISLDFSRMNRVLSINSEDLDCVVEPGITREDLNHALRDQGLFFPVDPGANASIGGMAATRASGTNAVRYGTMKDNILGLTAVLADGRIVKTGTRARKTSAGYDITRLLIGAEGTLGIITGITLRLHGIPEKISAATCSFPDVHSACRSVTTAIQMGLPIARIELLNALQVQACNAYSKLDLPPTPLLLLEFHGTEASVAEQAETFGEVASEFSGSAFAWTSSTEERNRLWKARHDAYFSVLPLRPGARPIATDVCVPVSRLADCVTEAEREADKLGFPAPIVGHVGDGNFHFSLLVMPDDPAEYERAKDFIGWLNDLAISMEGTCTGEHGIGQGKQPYLRRELGDTVDVMIAIKKALDPQNILNPGKIFEI
ncbi:FAD-binding oxidoreductase [Amaricoccus tamworthensis]|uniref:FAD-binding oxidoreductase n=1 Tax=Amaricoccus tamworthensis TaxID=57002 RepID=UPI003C7A63C9